MQYSSPFYLTTAGDYVALRVYLFDATLSLGQLIHFFLNLLMHRFFSR